MFSNLGKGKKESLALGVAIQQSKNGKELQKALVDAINAMIEKRITAKQFEALHELFVSRASELREIERLKKQERREKANKAVGSALKHVKRVANKLPSVKVKIEVVKKEDK